MEQQWDGYPARKSTLMDDPRRISLEDAPALDAALPEKTIGCECRRCCDKVLIIDDDEAQAMLSQILLERLGYEVVTCATGAEALRLIESGGNQFRFIASDYTMFPMDGLELVRNILRISPSAAVLLLTGFDHPSVLREAREIGVREVCTKPTTAEEFAEILQHAGL